jgi:hypothetical protein
VHSIGSRRDACIMLIEQTAARRRPAQTID